MGEVSRLFAVEAQPFPKVFTSFFVSHHIDKGCDDVGMSISIAFRSL